MFSITHTASDADGSIDLHGYSELDARDTRVNTDKV